MIVGAYYYSWYEKDWLCHTPHEGDPPRLGEYSSSSALVVDEHARMMSAAGIGFAAISWGKSCYDHVIEGMAKHGVKSCCLYESLIRSSNGKEVLHKDLDTILRDMDVISQYMDDPSWMKVSGRPVVMLYVTRVYRDWERAIPAIRKALGNVYLVGDELFWGPVAESKLRAFDAVTAYNMYKASRVVKYNEDLAEAMRGHLAVCSSAGVPLWFPVMPGYDDRYVRPDRKHPALPRNDRAFFAKQLEMACEAHPEVMMVTSFNEWYEGTQVESALSYGNKYLDMIQGLR